MRFVNEERLGVQLLVRTTRRLSLTQAGEQLYHNVESGFDALDMGLATLAHYRQTPSGTVRITPASMPLIKSCCRSWQYLNNAIPISDWN